MAEKAVGGVSSVLDSSPDLCRLARLGGGVFVLAVLLLAMLDFYA